MRIAIVGAAESDYGKVPNRSELDLHAQAAQRALDDAGLTRDDVDGVFTVTQEFIRSPSQTVCEYLGLRPRYEDCTAVGGSSFEVLVEHAMAALQANRIDVALITYGSTMLSSMGRTLGHTDATDLPICAAIRSAVRGQHRFVLRDVRAAPHAFVRHQT